MPSRRAVLPLLLLLLVLPAGVRALPRAVTPEELSLLTTALLIRVVASWFGASPYSWWMRIVGVLTDWLIEPIQRLLPRTGMVDFSPLVGYLLLRVAERVVMGAFF